MGAGDDVMYPQNLGCPLKSECSNSCLVVEVSSVAASVPCAGNFPFNPSASRTAAGVRSFVTGPRGIASREAAIWSTSAWPRALKRSASIASGAWRP